MDRDNIEANKRADRSCYFFGYDIKSRWIMGELKKFVNRFLFFSLSLSLRSNTRNNNEESYLSDESIILEEKSSIILYLLDTPRCCGRIRF